MAARGKYSLVLLILLTTFALKLGAQDTLNSGIVETTSYDLYLKKDWKGLEKFCERSIKSGFDYYYLRMRAGIAYYEMGQYRKAISHFKKALDFNNNDETANEYLYYSYAYAGQYEEARWLTKKFDSAFAVRIGTRNISPFSFSFAEAGVKVVDNSLFEPAHYFSLGLGHYVARRFSLLHAATFYSQNESRFATRQYQYYLKGNIPFKKGFSVIAGFHYAYNESSYQTLEVTQVKEIPGHFPVGLPPPPPGTPLPPSTYDTIRGIHVNKKYLNTVIGSVTLNKHFSFIDLNIGGTVASLDTAAHCQANAGFSLFPLRNNKLTIGAQVYYHSNNYFKSSFLAVAPSINLLLGKRVSLSLSYFTNSGNNTIEQTGYILNNSPDLTTNRFSAYLGCRLFRNVSVYALYGYEEKHDSGRGFYYYYNTIMTGIKITP